MAWRRSILREKEGVAAKDFHDPQGNGVAERAVQEKVHADTVLVSQGVQAAKLYFIAVGEARVLLRVDGGQVLQAGVLGPGDLFGEIGVTTKTDLSSGKHYGFGGKTAIPRLAEYALVFSVGAKNRHRSVGLISSAFSSAIGAGETKLPLCTWEAAGDTVRTVTTIETPLSMNARGASLKCILTEVKNIPFKSEAVRAAPSVYLGEISRPHMYLGVYLLSTSRGRMCISAVSRRISISRRISRRYLGEYLGEYLGGIS